MIRDRLVIALAVVGIASVIGCWQWRTIGELRESVSELKATVSAAGAVATTSEGSARSLSALPERRQGGSRSVRDDAGTDTSAGQADRVQLASVAHTWALMVDELGLSDAEADEMENVARRVLESRGRIDRDMINAAAKVLGGSEREIGFDRVDELLRERRAFARESSLLNSGNFLARGELAVLKRSCRRMR